MADLLAANAMLFLTPSTGLMGIRKSRFGQFLQDPYDKQEASIKHDCFDLALVCALEDSDKLQAPVDFLELPELVPVELPTIPTIPTLPNSARRLPSLASLRRRHGLPSLASFKRQHVHSEVGQPGRPSDEGHVNSQLHAGRKNNEDMFECNCQELGTLAKIKSSFLTPYIEIKESQMTTTIPSDGPSGKSAHQLPFSRDPASIIDPEPLLVGAASLGLRRKCKRVMIAPPRHKATHVGPSTSKAISQIGKTPKDEGSMDEGCAAAGSKPQVQATIKVPHAPCKPKPQGHGKRPQIYGAPVLVIPQG